jgi:hypothetical protein
MCTDAQANRCEVKVFRENENVPLIAMRSVIRIPQRRAKVTGDNKCPSSDCRKTAGEP